MKFTCLQENLVKGLQIVTKAVPVKGSLPVLSNILLEIEDGRLKLCATNLETAITTYVPCSVQAQGAITIPSKLLREFVTNLPSGTIEADSDGHSLTLKSNKTKSKLNGISADEFPELPKFPEDSKNIIELDPKEFSEAVSFVAFASGTDDSRPMFTGVYLNATKGLLTVACTDGFRLSEKVLSLHNQVAEMSVVIPAKTLLEVSKVFATSTEPIKFVLNEGENLSLFKSDDTTIATRVLDGEYPDYKRIVPQETMLKAIFSNEDFVEAVKLTNVFAKEGNNAIKIRFDPEEGIKITSLAEESGEHQSELTAEIEGPLTEIAFSSKYLIDYLNNIKTPKIVFRTKGNISPCLFEAEEIKGFFHIIMPMQI